MTNLKRWPGRRGKAPVVLLAITNAGHGGRRVGGGPEREVGGVGTRERRREVEGEMKRKRGRAEKPRGG